MTPSESRELPVEESSTADRGTLFSVVIAIFNDGALARDAVLQVTDSLSPFSADEDVEFIFINDGSVDDSMAYLTKLVEEFKTVTVIDLSRNFGQHAALSCGYLHARGDFIIRMNVDLQDHPRELRKLAPAALTGEHDLVVGRYSARKSPFLTRMSALIYFYSFNALTGFKVPQNTAPMRIMSRRFVNQLNRLTEKQRFPQGIDQWLGFNHFYVPINHSPRAIGKSSYNAWSRLKLAAEGVLYFSDRPLKLIAGLGFVLASVGFLMGSVVAAQKITGSDLLPGYASLLSLLVLGFGIQIGCIGMLGLYLGGVFREVQNRPFFIVRQAFGPGNVE